MITRADWGAGPHRARPIPTPVQDLFAHHSATPFWTGAQAGRRLQQIARARGFLDGSYSWLADRAGNEIEGRGWGRQGAHTRGHNDQHALCFVGNLETRTMPAGMVRAAVRIVRRHRRYGPGQITRPHSAVSATACPGRHGRARIPVINRAAKTSASEKGFLMSLNPNQQLWVWRWLRALQHKSSSPEWMQSQSDQVNNIVERVDDIPTDKQWAFILPHLLERALAEDGHARQTVKELIHEALDERDS